jgi:hypothetical protein
MVAIDQSRFSHLARFASSHRRMNLWWEIFVISAKTLIRAEDVTIVADRRWPMGQHLQCAPLSTPVEI